MRLVITPPPNEEAQPPRPVAEFLRDYARSGRLMLDHRSLTTTERVALAEWIESFDRIAELWERVPAVTLAEVMRLPPTG